jgi:Flp pilus assembly CpaE family ATPase
MKYAAEMGSGAMMYIPSFIKIGSGIEKLLEGSIHRQHGDCISLLSLFKNKQSRLKMYKFMNTKFRRLTNSIDLSPF